MYEIAYAAVLGTGILVATMFMMMMRRSAPASEHRNALDASNSVYIEELTPTKATVTSTVESVSKNGHSDKDFEEIFLDVNNSIDDIAKACGYKSRSSVYRRAKKLGLSVKARRKQQTS